MMRIYPQEPFHGQPPLMDNHHNHNNLHNLMDNHNSWTTTHVFIYNSDLALIDRAAFFAPWTYLGSCPDRWCCLPSQVDCAAFAQAPDSHGSPHRRPACQVRCMADPALKHRGLNQRGHFAFLLS